VFAGFFGLVASILINIKHSRRTEIGSRHSAFIGLIGTGFVFATFPFTGIIFPSGATSNVYRVTEGPLNVYFSLTASVICTYISSTLFGARMEFRTGIREALVGTISGGVTIAVVAGSIDSIGACIAIVAFSGLVSGFWLRIIHPRINRNSSIDHLGLFGPILINAILGGLVLAPALFQTYTDIPFSPDSLGSINSSLPQKYELAFIGIAAGTGIVFGLLAGIFGLFARSDIK